MKKTILILTAVAFVFSSVLTSCKKEKNVTGVTLSQTTLSLEIGASATLTATVAPSDADNASLTWASSDETVATVSNGTVTAKKEGTTTITVTTNDGGFNATCAVTVGKTYNIEVSAYYTDGTNLYNGVNPFPLPGGDSSIFVLTAYFIDNISGETIPAGTTFSYKTLINSTVTRDTTYKLEKDLADGAYFAIIDIPLFNSSNSHVGENSTCMSVAQLGTVKYSSPRIGCIGYTVIEAGSPSIKLVNSSVERKMNQEMKDYLSKEFSAMKY